MIRLYASISMGVLILIAVAGCAYQRPPGQWVRIDAPAVYFTSVGFGRDAVDPIYTKTCQEAREEIEQQLVRRFPKHLSPLDFYGPKKSPAVKKGLAVFRLEITKCKVEVQQWDVAGGEPSISFYLTLAVRVRLAVNGRPLLTHAMVTYEQVHTDTPTPLFDFTFTEPVDRTLLLFDKGNVWLPKPSS